MSLKDHLRPYVPDRVRPYLGSALRTLSGLAKTVLRFYQPPKIHSLDRNIRLGQSDYLKAVKIVHSIQSIYDTTLRYLDDNRLERALFLPGNEWTQIVPVEGVKFRHSYDDINYLRLMSPFAGYYLAILDRMDTGGRFDKADHAFVDELSRIGIPSNIAEIVNQRFPPAKRLQHVVPDYLDHIRNVPDRYVVRTPRLFGEIGLEINDLLVNPDVVLCQSRINGMLSAGILDHLDNALSRKPKVRILEIGAGYGSLAYALCSIFGYRVEYVVIDLPTSLFHSAIYLSTLLGEGCEVIEPGGQFPQQFNCVFLANHLVNEFCEHLGPVDLAINVMSSPEMTVEQVSFYGDLIKRLIGQDGAYFDQNAVIAPHHVDNKKIFDSRFDYRKRVTSEIIKTMSWCQDVWTNRYIGTIYDCADAMVWKRDTVRSEKRKRDAAS